MQCTLGQESAFEKSYSEIFILARIIHIFGDMMSSDVLPSCTTAKTIGSSAVGMMINNIELYFVNLWV